MIVEHSYIIKNAFKKYKSIHYKKVNLTEKFTPKKYSDIKKSSISIEEFHKLCKQRYSVRWYKNEIVNVEKVKMAIQIALTSPSACNRQSFRFEYIDKPEYVNLCKSLPIGTDVFADNIKSIMFIIGDMSAFGNSRGRHLLYLDTGLAVMTLMHSLELLGISSCPLHWADIKEREDKLTKLLNLKPYEKCIIALSIGYALEDGKVLHSQRRDIDTVWNYNNVYTA